MVALWFVSITAVDGLTEDRVLFESRRGQELTLRGTIVDWDESSIQLRTADGSVRPVPVERVLRVETDYTPSHQDAIAAAATGRLDQAAALYQQALAEETRRWMRHRILRDLVQALRDTGHAREAGEMFLVLERDRPTVDDYAEMPLAWEPGVPSSDLDRAARRWIARDDLPAAVLLGASHLMATDRTEALRRLDRLIENLSKNEDKSDPVLLLAKAQRRRADLVTADAPTLERWAEAIDAMPESLRAGPFFLLGRGWARLGETDRAVLAWLRVPILYPNQTTLADRARRLAAELKRNAGQTDEAERIELGRVDSFGI